MRVANWKAKEIFDGIYDDAVANANSVMDDVAREAKSRCPVSQIVRDPVNKTVTVRISPRTGRRKGQEIVFTAEQFQGRHPGQLRDTIRRVNRHGQYSGYHSGQFGISVSYGNIRVYAGNYHVFYAHMVERGTRKTKAQPFLNPAFNGKKGSILHRIKNGR